MAGRFLMGLDLGGSKGRCLLVDVRDGHTVSAFRAWRHRTVPDTGGFGFDLDTEEVCRLLGQAAKEALSKAHAAPKDILAVATTGMRHGQVVLDREGAVLLATPTRDARGAFQGLALAAERGREFYEHTGHWPAPLFAGARLLWMAENASALLERAHTLLGLSEWLAFRLSGRRFAEASTASETLLFDVHARRWADALIDSLHLPRRLFPQVLGAGARLGPLTREAAAQLGLAPGIPVVVGGGDTQCGILGAGAAETGQLGVIAGTTMAVQLVLDRPRIDQQARLWTSHHVVPGCWVLEGNGGPAGEMLDWIGGLLYPTLPEPAGALVAEAADSVPGAEGLVSTLGAEVFHASQMSLPLGHLTVSPMMVEGDGARRCHVAQAMLEGMAYAVRANLDQIREVAAAEPKALRLGGGMSRSAQFAQILSEVTELPVEVPSTPEASALGAAICAGVGAGVYRNLAAGAAALARAGRTHVPDAARCRAYGTLYEGWLDVRRARAQADVVASGLALRALTCSQARAIAPAPAASAAFRPRILCTAALDEPTLEALRKLGEVEYANYRAELRLLTGDDLVSALAGRHVLVTEVDAVDADVLSRLPDLRVVASCRGNAVNVDIEACTAHGIPVLTAPGRNSDGVADLTVAFLLMLARKLPGATQFLRQPGGEAGDIGRMGRAYQDFQGQELWHKIVGLVGLGAVGRAVAQRLTPFGVRILACDPHVSPEQAARCGAELSALERLLEDSDFVSLHAAVTDGAPALLGRAELEKMKRGAFLVNTARAALVDQDALVEALRSGRLAGAALDVFDVEPPAPDHPLLGLPNVIATPHVGGNTLEVSAHQGALVSAALAQLVRGERPSNLANPETLEGFSWAKPRPTLSAEVLERLRQRSRPRVSDIERGEQPTATTARRNRPSLFSRMRRAFGNRKAEGSGARSDNGQARAAAGNGQPDRRARAQMTELLTSFVQRVSQDPRLLSFSEGREVTVRYDLPDLNLVFYTGFHNGAVVGGLGDPPEKPQVMLKMRAEILDQIFTGRLKGTTAAMSGKLSFSGDTIKAMSLQRIQKDLNRLYAEVRAQAGDLDTLLGAAEPALPAAPGPVALARAGDAGDERDVLVRTVEELYAIGLITSTGGNASMRVPGRAGELWITPNHAHKGGLKPHMLVRIDLEGNPVGESAFAPSSERMLHCAICRRSPQIGAVIHSHAPKATIMALAELPFLPISTEAAFIGEIPRVPFIMPGSPELADAVAQALEHAPAVLMQNHGLIVAASDLRHAADMTLIIEQTADKLLACHALGKTPPVLPKDVVAALQSLDDMIA